MYLLIAEDFECAERTPPWGESTIEAYIERVRRNLSFVSAHSAVKIGYEWSGVELEMLARDAPDVIKELQELEAQGRVTFYNGTYAQPHLQMLTSEANVRQFEEGLAVYRRLGLPTPVTYAHQESSLHDQVPQMLAAFGLEFGALPGFSCMFAMGSGAEFNYLEHDGLRVLEGDEFVSWEGLDGTCVPFYLGRHERQDREWRRRESLVGLLHIPPVLVDIPDLVGMDDAWLARHSEELFVLLDEALKERVAVAPPRVRARIWSGWSYLEGIRAEELCRVDRQAEDTLARAEALGAIASSVSGFVPNGLGDSWARVLKGQHHDAYCFSAPALRAQSIEQIRAAEATAAKEEERAASALVGLVRTTAQEGQPILVVNPLPHPVRTIVEVGSSLGQEIVDGSGQACPSDGGGPGGRTRFVAELDGLGWRVYFARRSEAVSAQAVQPTAPVRFKNSFYGVEIEADGRISSLRLAGIGVDLVARDAGGNVVTATDSRGVSPCRRGPADLKRLEWQPPELGPPISFVPSGPPTVRRTPLGLSFGVSGAVGSETEAQLSIECYMDIARIDITWTFEFSDASIGTFFDDESKLVLRWGFGFDGDLTHDIPFGTVAARTGRPILPTQWADWSNESYGLAQIHAGTGKQWMTDRTLSTLVAWGEETDAIGNRFELTRWSKCFDQRLRGTHTIRTAIYPHVGSWRAGVIEAARSFRRLVAAYPVERHDGVLEPEVTLLKFPASDVSATSVQAEGSGLSVRLYEHHGKTSGVPTVTDGLVRDLLRSLSGEKIEALGPFQIGRLSLVPGGRD
jgi:hypothetical protein